MKTLLFFCSCFIISIFSTSLCWSSVDCSSDSESTYEVSLVQPGKKLYGLKPQNQDGLGTCYANTASLMLQSSIPGMETKRISPLDLALAYGQKYNFEGRATTRTSSVQNGVVQNNVTSIVEGGFTCGTIREIKKNGGVCFTNTVHLEREIYEGSLNPDIQSDLTLAIGDYFDSLYSASSKKNKAEIDMFLRAIRKSLKKVNSDLLYECAEDETLNMRELFLQSFNKIKLKKNKQEISKKNIQGDIRKIRKEIKNLKTRKRELRRRLSNRNITNIEKVELNNVLPKLLDEKSKELGIKNSALENINHEIDNSNKQMKQITNFPNQVVTNPKDFKINRKLERWIESDREGKYKSLLQKFESEPEQRNNFYSSLKESLKNSGIDSEILDINFEDQYVVDSENIFDNLFQTDNMISQNLYDTILRNDIIKSNPEKCYQYELQSFFTDKNKILKSINMDKIMCDKFRDSVEALGNIFQSPYFLNGNKPSLNLISEIINVLENQEDNNDVGSFMLGLIGPECLNNRHPIPENLNCNSHSFRGNAPTIEEAKLKFKEGVLRNVDNGKTVGVNVCTAFKRDPLANSNYGVNCSTSGEPHGYHVMTTIGYRCKNGRTQYLIQNSWGNDCFIGFSYETNNNEYGECEKNQNGSNTLSGRFWIDEDILVRNMQVFSEINYE